MRIFVDIMAIRERVIGNLLKLQEFCISCDKLCIFAGMIKTLIFKNISDIYTT